jgi:hypothetical protein
MYQLGVPLSNVSPAANGVDHGDRATVEFVPVSHRSTLPLSSGSAFTLGARRRCNRCCSQDKTQPARSAEADGTPPPARAANTRLSAMDEMAEPLLITQRSQVQILSRYHQKRPLRDHLRGVLLPSANGFADRRVCRPSPRTAPRSFRRLHGPHPATRADRSEP